MVIYWIFFHSWTKYNHKKIKKNKIKKKKVVSIFHLYCKWWKASNPSLCINWTLLIIHPELVHVVLIPQLTQQWNSANENLILRTIIENFPLLEVQNAK